jgi:hypothetical protein
MRKKKKKKKKEGQSSRETVPWRDSTQRCPATAVHK